MLTSSKGSLSAHTLPKSNRKMKPEQLEKKFEQLYHQSEKWKSKKLQTIQQSKIAKSIQEVKQCTFKPTFISNPQVISMHDPSSFLQRGQFWQQKKKKKVQQLAKVYEQRANKECSFRPQVSKNSYNLLHNPKKSKIVRNESYVQNSQNKNSYRQIHLKKETLKQLHKTNSVFEFKLLTERHKDSEKLNSSLQKYDVQKVVQSPVKNPQIPSLYNLQSPYLLEKEVDKSEQIQISNKSGTFQKGNQVEHAKEQTITSNTNSNLHKDSQTSKQTTKQSSDKDNNIKQSSQEQEEEHSHTDLSKDLAMECREQEQEEEGAQSDQQNQLEQNYTAQQDQECI